jgi:iron-sulfur cluster repair protein YtfE (RIC family)
MTNGPTPSRALAELADQHARLRDLIERCDELADALDAGRLDPAVLLDEVARLRSAFETHNQFEEQLLQPVLLDADWLGAVRVARMLEEHVDEHRSMGRQLVSVPAAMPGPTSELRATLASLRAHLEAEEQSFLSKRVLRDDLVR